MSRAVLKFISYDTTTFNFAPVVADTIFQIQDISQLHKRYWRQKRAQGESLAISYEENLQERNRFKSLLPDSPFYTLFHDFILGVIAPLFGHKLTHTHPPTFRVHMPGSPTVSAWHRDTDVHGRHDLITLWIPFVDTFDTNTIWVETEYGKKNYEPIAVNYGQVLLFDSSYLWHGSVFNQTNITRVSMDFRVTPKNDDAEQPDFGILSGRPKDYYESAPHHT